MPFLSKAIRVGAAWTLILAAACSLTTSLDGLAGAVDGFPDGGADGPTTTSDAPIDTPDGAVGCGSDLQSDRTNCGVCGHSCLGATCVGGVCQPTLMTRGNVVCLALDDVRVFWAHANGDLRSQSKNGGPTINYYDAGLPVSRCAVDGALFLLAYSGGQAGIAGYPKAGGSVVPVVTNQTGLPYGVVSKNGVFFTNSVTNVVGECVTVPCNDTPGIVASAQANPYGIAADEARVYWTNRGDGTVRSAGRGPTSSVVTVAGGQSAPGGIAVDETDLYWANQGGSIMKMSKTGTSPQAIATGQDAPESLVLDAASVYWVNAGGSVMKLAKGGGKPFALAVGQSRPWDLAVDDTHVYWANYSDDGGGLYRVAK